MASTPIASTRVWFLSFGFWTLFGLISAAQVYVRSDNSAGFVREVGNIVYFYWAWALVTPFILHATRHFVREPRSVMRLMATALLVLAGVLLVQGALYAAFGILAGRVGGGSFMVVLGRSVVRHLAGNVLTFAAIVGAVAALEQVRRASRFEADLARAQLATLSAQLNPHFLFNTLNLISGLVATRDAETANRAIARLGEVLRASLKVSPADTVPLRDELALARKYLEIAQLRYGDRLTIAEEIEAASLDAPVPPLLLQPLLENALEHGVGSRASGGTLRISARVEGGHVGIWIEDDGPGFAVDALHGAGGNGVGLDNVRRRLAHQFGHRALLTTENVVGGGARATVRLPRAT